ncbi:hypothetical protein O6H91_06G069200 [Diphasiastrum complanatum]|uniref:Uncharacterized protein n=1 Tax=Diphasiastrum complanatum TaxID=34168 RepID=A0ACC2DFL4_DIPCM|nr:hypothetical protein O6H91_06G069200 [Diphasiastrum complanatum]
MLVMAVLSPLLRLSRFGALAGGLVASSSHGGLKITDAASHLSYALPLPVAAVRGFMACAWHAGTHRCDYDCKLESFWGLKRQQLLSGSWMGAKVGYQVRGVYVEVKDDNFELALNKYGRLMRQDKTLNELSKRQFYLKPSERRVLARKERDRRIARREFKEKLRWIMSRRSRGF